ncbi:Hypothetical protein NTJ_11657 [Nesidiocoris tenuis]|uniref:SOCS box domain-containing protein n=1 Tax=Nesidiocoris tenuis TaxID=355587 RepID=A0ABN7B358_9HEMI|nr:Hypothetical protein NTJ_11657 [Nesidiocoris tenuis]
MWKTPPQLGHLPKEKRTSLGGRAVWRFGKVSCAKQLEGEDESVGRDKLRLVATLKVVHSCFLVWATLPKRYSRTMRKIIMRPFPILAPDIERYYDC